MPYKLSPHSLNLFSECQRCFYNDIKEGKRRPSGPFPSLPSGMDSIIKKHFDEYRKTNRLPPELCGLQDINLKGVTLFADEKLVDEWRHQRHGLVWKDEKGNTLHGALDEVLERDDKLIVLDYKTRGFPLREVPTYYTLQLETYNLLLRKNGHQTEDYAFLLFYYPEVMEANGVVIFNTQLVKIKTNADNARKTFTAALTLLNGTKPEKNEKCGFCNY